MGANHRIIYAVAGAAAIVLGSAGAGYGVYDAWQQEQTRSERSMPDPQSPETNSDGSSTLRNSPSTGNRTTTPTPEPSRATTDRDRSDSSSPDDSPSKTSKPDNTDNGESSEKDKQSEPEPTATSDQGDGQDSDASEPSPEATAASSQESQFASEVVRLTNIEREQEGCDALRTDPDLAKAARTHSDDMAERDYFDHEAPDGTTPWKRMLNAGYEQPAAENIAKGQADPESVVEAWMDSSGHRRNILDCSYQAIGVGVELDEGPYWTQNFGFG